MKADARAAAVRWHCAASRAHSMRTQNCVGTDRLFTRYLSTLYFGPKSALLVWSMTQCSFLYRVFFTWADHGRPDEDELVDGCLE